MYTSHEVLWIIWYTFWGTLLLGWMLKGIGVLYTKTMRYYKQPGAKRRAGFTA